MKIELYRIPNDREGEKLKEFLIKNNIPFKEIMSDDVSTLSKIAQMPLIKKISLLKVTYSSSIGIIDGFNKLALNQLVEHVKKYSPTIKID